MDEGSDPKPPRRKRVSRACDRCRSKKDKCDGLRPACTACRASGLTCSYDPHAKKRGLPEGYVRGLEKLWALSICNIDGFEDTMLALLGNTSESTGRRDRLMDLWADDGASETLHESWKSSRLYGVLEKMLSTSAASPVTHLSGKRPREDEGVGVDGDWGFRIERSSTPIPKGAPRAMDPPMSPNSKRPRLSQPVDSALVSQAANTLHAPLHLPALASQLLDLYFATTHSWLPIVPKHNILRASYLYANAPLSVAKEAPGSGDHAALWALLSYTFSQSLTNPQDRSVLHTTREYYSVARSLIPAETERYEIGHVQALLLLTLVNVGVGEWNAAWLLIGQAVRMAIALDLGILTDMRRSEDVRQGKAVFLGCFVLDSLLSFRLSRRPCMHSQDLSTVGLLEEDGLEEWNSWADVLPPSGGTQGRNSPRRGPLRAISCFNRLVELASVLNNIARESTTESIAPAAAQQLVLELKQWDDRLPLGCRLIGPDSIYPERHSALLPHQSYLGMTYVATLLWLYLRIAPQELERHRTQRPAVEGAKKLLYRALPMISQHLDNFGSCGLPPIFEFSLRTIAQQAFILRKKIEPEVFPFGRWTDALLQHTMELSSTWSVYRSLATNIEDWYQSNEIYESAAPTRGFDATTIRPPYIPPTTMFAPDAMAMPTRQQPLDDETAMHPRPQMRLSETAYPPSVLGISIPVDGQYMTPKDATADTADPSMLDISLQPQIDRSRGSTLAEKPGSSKRPPPTSHPQPPTPDSSISNAPPPGTPAPTDPHIPSREENRSLHPAIPDTESLPPAPSSSSDIDAIFSDLAYLDTTEWATSREAGLKDFGFLDDSTFQAFCHDPDRLVGSEPLVHPSSIADIWPPPGFFPETFQDSARLFEC
ncbi:C6 transcription factor [Aspergillus campestris IBT 28561]|uniref:C6 transcription factor n=1 Tax=Aspergillus campestris (strain IBT 28561) TaxID=1392248 RepID=A0A2I1CRD4_ASPC2|nr:C6 transcription factor [Aspergillus campestris IBT 28561]PKY00179.1 C6 transcription factor [Aspergillus campestris IBT 28561]